MNALIRVLKVRPEEGRLAFLLAMLFLSLQAGQGLGDNGASALFFLRFGVDFLPYMYVLLGACTFVTVLVYSAALGRFDHGRFFQFLILGLMVVLVAERAGLGKPFPLLYPLTWLTVSAMGAIVGTFSWNLAGETSDPRRAKRLFPLFSSAGILGSVLGNSATGWIARGFGAENLLLFDAGLLGVGLLLTRATTGRFLRAEIIRTQHASLLGDVRAGLDFVRGSRLMQLVAYASVLFSILYFSIAFPFSKVVTASFPDEAAVAGFLGMFSTVTTVVTFAASLFIANRLYLRFGIVNSILLMPAAYIFGFALLGSRASLTGAVVARGVQVVVLGGVAATAWNAIFNVVPSQKRAQVLAFENGVPAQIGVALSGVLLLLGKHVLTLNQILQMGMILTLVCGWLVWRMRGAYGEALLDALRAGRLEVFSSDNPGFAGLGGDAAALNVVIRASKNPKAAIRLLAAEIFGKMQNPAAIPTVAHLLNDGEPSVRAAALSTLGELHAESELVPIMGALDDSDPAVVLQALLALGRMNLGPAADLRERLERLLQCPIPAVRIEALALLAKLGQPALVLPHLSRWLESRDTSLLRDGLEAFGKIALALDEQLEGVSIVGHLDDTDASIRIAACHALAGLNDESSARGLANCLSDPLPAVRRAAAESLRRRGPGSNQFVLGVLESGDASACEAALAALSPGDEAVSARLWLFAFASLPRLRLLRFDTANLPSEGPATRLLRAMLEGEFESGEARLVTILGLIGSPRAMELVAKGIRGASGEARAAALEALDTLGDKALARGVLGLMEDEPARSSPTSILNELLREDSCWIRALAVRSVQELGIRELIPVLAELRTDPDPLVHEAAQAALVHFAEVGPMNTLQTVSTLERVLLLRDIPIFSELLPEDLQQIALTAREMWFPGNSVLAREGEQGDTLFIVVEGELAVLRQQDGLDRVIAKRGPGDFVGESAIIDVAPRSATLLTHTDVRVLAIDGETFKGILTERPAVAMAVLRSLSRRLRELTP